MSLESRECAVCGTTKRVPKSSYKHKHGWVCSKECNKKSYRKEVICETCGTEDMELKSKSREGSYFCSKQCKARYICPKYTCDNCGDRFREHNRNRQYGQYNYCNLYCKYEHESKSGYTSGEHQRWAESVKRRDSYICQECGNSYDVMSAHHSPPKSELSNTEKQKPENGVCLCYPCHANKHNNQQRKALLSWWEWYQTK